MTTIKNKTMKVDEEIEPTGEPRQIEIAEPGFTRGPWEVSTTITSTGDWPCVRGALDEDGGWVIALIDQLCTPRSTWEPEANARLIAAAPALYEALRNLLNCKWVSGTTSARVTEGFAALALVDPPAAEERNK